jgi:hypothetical protein
VVRLRLTLPFPFSPDNVVAAAAATGMTTGTTAKPRSPRRSRSPPSNPSRLIAPNTPAKGIARPLEDSTRPVRSQTPDARAASPEEEDVNAIPTKGPLRVRKDTIAVKKRANQIREAAKAREAARTRSPTGSILSTVQRARRSARPNIPQPGAMTISPETSIPSQQQMPTDEEEADTEGDTVRRQRRRSNSEIRRQAPQNRTQIASLHNIDNLLGKRVKHQPKEPLQHSKPQKRTKRFGMMPQTKPKLYLLRTGPRVLDLSLVSKDS